MAALAANAKRNGTTAPVATVPQGSRTYGYQHAGSPKPAATATYAVAHTPVATHGYGVKRGPVPAAPTLVTPMGAIAAGNHKYGKVIPIQTRSSEAPKVITTTTSSGGPTFYWK